MECSSGCCGPDLADALTMSERERERLRIDLVSCRHQLSVAQQVDLTSLPVVVDRAKVEVEKWSELQAAMTQASSGPTYGLVRVCTLELCVGTREVMWRPCPAHVYVRACHWATR